ncbi:MAG TPA: flagellar hook-associated protein FlgK [Rhodocyclaceae bacterium]|nr:flagellar hook-associated protein FlgK [Rhodocyclaceae bacterium]
MSASTLTIAVTGLNAAQAGLLTTSHNISNASTAGYSRQNVVQTTQNPFYTGSGFIGQGTRVLSVQRAYSSFLSTAMYTSQASTSQLESYLTQLNAIDNMLGDTTVGMSPAINGFYDGVNDVVANPSSIPSRQSMLANAQSLVSRFKDIQARLQQLNDGVNTQIKSEVTTINSYSQQIADINQRIIIAEAAGGDTQPANDLRDQRDQLILELNQHVSTNVIEQTDGSFSVFFGNGQPLVVGTSRYTLSTTAASDDPSRLTLSLSSSSGQTSQIPESLVSGGALGGLLKFRTESLDDAQNRLGLMAVGLSSAFNDQHALGQNLNGAMGGNFFNVPQPVVTYDSGNTGSGTISVTLNNVSAMLPSDYTLDYGAGGYTLRRLSDNTTLFSNQTLPQTVDGITIDLAGGTPAVGDSFKLQPTRYAARDISVAITDPREIAAASPVTTTAASTNVGTVVMSPGKLLQPLASVPTYNLTYDLTSGEIQGFPAGTPIDVTVNGTTTSYTIGTAPATTGIPYTDGMTIQIDASAPADGVKDIEFQFTGTPKQGDKFTLTQSSANSADNRNVQALAALQTSKILLGGTASVESAYAQMVSTIGNKAREVGVAYDSQASLLEQAQTAIASFSGVNLDEEAANLLRYQQAYQASAKIIDISGKLFDLLASLGG